MLYAQILIGLFVISQSISISPINLHKNSKIIEQIPYQVQIEYYGLHWCGGAILNHYTIITAAHCTFERHQNMINIRAGSSISLYGGVSVGVRKIYEHPKYNKENFDFDMALIFLTQRLNFTMKIQPIDILTSYGLSNEQKYAAISGWGQLLYQGGLQTVIKKMIIPVLSQGECQKYYKEHNITSAMFCGGEFNSEKDACQGNSGGPLVWNGTIIGVVSWGYTCGVEPGVYANVTYVKEWIQETVNNELN